MSYRSVKFISALVVGASLLYVYLVFAVAFVQKVDPSGLNPIEQAIVITQAARLVAVFVVPRLRKANAEVVWTLFSLESFFVVGLMGLFLYTSDVYYSRVVVDVFSTWITTLLLLTPPYTVFRYSANMVKGSKLWGIFLSIIMEFGFLLFLNNMISQISAPINFGDFLSKLIVNVREDVVGRKNPVAVGSHFAEPAVLLYVGLIVYAAFPHKNAKPNPTSVLVPALASTVALFGWISLAAAFIPSTLLSLTAPTLILVALIWWLTNEK
jgi:hypothetical protein